MSVDTRIAKPLENGYVQVNAEYKGGYKRYFKLPERGAKVFADEFAKQDKRMVTYGNIAYFSSIFTGVLGMAFFAKNVKSGINKFLLECCGALGLAVLSTIVINDYTKSEEENLLKQFKAKEIYYRA